MNKYKVVLTFIETVEAEDEDDAKLIARGLNLLDEEE